jgi:transposase
MRGWHSNLQAGGDAALPPLSVPTRKCQYRAVGSACNWPGEAAACWALTHTYDTDPVPVRRAYKFRAYPTQPQQGRAVRLLADHCDLYNAALMERREAWRARRVSIGYGAQSAQLKEIRRTDPDGQGRHSFTAQQQTLRRLGAVFAAFFDRVRAADKAGRSKKPGYPRVKPYQRFSQVMFVAGDGAKWQPTRTGRWAYATFQAVGRVKVAQHTSILTGKAVEAGRRVVLVNPAGTSIGCHRCGRRCTRPQQKTVICPVHGLIDADVNAARNIASRAGLGSGQAAPAA